MVWNVLNSNIEVRYNIGTFMEVFKSKVDQHLNRGQNHDSDNDEAQAFVSIQVYFIMHVTLLSR